MTGIMCVSEVSWHYCVHLAHESFHRQTHGYGLLCVSPPRMKYDSVGRRLKTAWAGCS